MPSVFDAVGRASEITVPMLESMIENQASELPDLEFKSQMWGPGTDEKREMLRDITSMANAGGGYFLIGVEEEDSVATKLVGIEIGQYVDSVLESCASNIEPRIRALDVHALNLGERQVLVVRVPRSLGRPHLITFKGMYQFWIRHGTTKHKMSRDEVAAAVVESRAVMNRADDDWADLLERTADRFGSTARLELGLYPLPASDDLELDTPDVRAALAMRWGWESVGHDAPTYVDSPAPSLRGLRATDSTDWLELHANGALELVRRVAVTPLDMDKVFLAVHAAPLVVSRLSGLLNLSSSYSMRVRITDIQGRQLKLRDEMAAWGESVLDLGERRAELDSQGDAFALGGWYGDRIARIFGHESAPWKVLPAAID